MDLICERRVVLPALSRPRRRMEYSVAAIRQSNPALEKVHLFVCIHGVLR